MNKSTNNCYKKYASNYGLREKFNSPNMGRKRRGGFCAAKILGGSSSNFAAADSSPPYQYRGDLGMGSYYCAGTYDYYINCVRNPSEYGFNCGTYEESLIKLCGGVAEGAKCFGPKVKNDECAQGGPVDCRAMRKVYDGCIEKGGSLPFCDSFESYVKTWCPVKD